MLQSLSPALVQFNLMGLPHPKMCIRDRDMEGIALWSHLLAFQHPQTGQDLRFEAPPPKIWPWTQFPRLWPKTDVTK